MASDISIYTEHDAAVMCVYLGLAYGNLKELEHHNRKSLRKIDTWINPWDFSYDFSNNIENIKKEVSRYPKIRIWIREDEVYSFLTIRYVFHEFYDQLKSKDISLICLNRLYENGYTSTFDLERCYKKENQIVLTQYDVEKYKEEWEEQIRINSEVRDLRNGKIKNLSYADLYEPVYKFISKYKRKHIRGEIISRLMASNILNEGKPVVYNHIINCLIQQGRIEMYPIDDIIEVDEHRDNMIKAIV